MKQLPCIVSKSSKGPDNIFNVKVIISSKVKGKNNIAVYQPHVNLTYLSNMELLPFIVSKKWSEQNFHGVDHSFTVKGLNVKISLQ